MAERGTAALDALKTELETMAVPYSVDRFLSSGSYGVVCAGTDKLTGHPVAVKRVHTTRSENRVLNILGDPFLARRVIREVRLLGHFHHPNILGLKDLMVAFGRSGSHAGDHRLYLVTELMKTDLGQVIHDPKMELTREYVQYYMYHVLLGLHTLHRAGVVHRDLHPGNILLSKDNDVKICDFNLAREDSTSDEKTYYVTHRWYRAPELVMQYRGFSKGVDIWSAGCVMAELYTRKALFRGTTFYNQLNKIIEIIGTPKAEDYESFASQSAAEYLRNSLGAIPSRTWKSVIPGADDVALDLLTRMLQFNPAKRISVEEALAHPFFEDHFDPADLQLYQSPTFHFDDGGDNQITTLHRILQEDVDIWAHRRRERLAAVAAAAGKTAPPQDPDAAASPVASQFVSNGHFPRTGSSVSFD